MLVLPIKKADAFDTTKPLSTFLTKEYSTEASKYENSLTSFLRIRNNAISVSGSSGQLGFHNILRYNYHMKSIAKRLSGYESEIKFAFSWVDAFNPSKRIVTGSLHHDWACVLWNLASLESHRGTHVDRSTNEGIRAASQHFQQAAGVFSLLKSDIVPKINGVKSEELCDGFLNVLLNLNLAQAQICFYEKAVRDKKAGNMKAGLVAKLAKQVAKFYEQAVTQSRDKEVVRCLDQAWVHHMDFQRECFQGAAEYWQAHAVKDEALAVGKGFGEEITRLARAEDIFTSTISLGKSKRIHAATLSTAETFLDAVKRLKFTAVKDNETIYHDPVPERGALAEVIPIAMVKPSQLPSYPTNPNVSPEEPLFADVLPKEVRSLLTTYRERVASIVSQTESIATKATDAGRADLASMGLPGSLEVYKSRGTFPSNLWRKIQNLQARGGGTSGLSADLMAKIEDLERLANRARTTIDSIDYSIRREENIDNSFRERFPSYSVPQSHELNKDIRRNVELMLQAHEIAKSNDQTMINRVQGKEFQEYLRLLSMSLAELEAQLPQDSSASSSSLVNTTDLEGHLVKIANLFETRGKALINLKTHVGDHELVATETFIDSSLGPDAPPEAIEEAVSVQLRALESLTGPVTITLAEQQQLLDDVMKANDAFNQARSNEPAQEERERIIKQLEQGISAYSQSQSQLSAGSTFYMDMQSRLTSMMQQCDDLSYTQQLQRQEHEVDALRDQDRNSQVESDHDMALRLAEEMDRMTTGEGQSNEAPPAGEQRQLPQFGYPKLQQQQQQPSPHLAYQQLPPPSPTQQQQLQPPLKPPKPGKMDVAYGQPVNGPPSGSVQQSLQYNQQLQQQHQQHQQQQYQYGHQQKQHPSQSQATPPSHAYASHFQPPSQQSPQPSTSTYVYNAGFNNSDNNSGSAVTVSQQGGGASYQPPLQHQQAQQYQQPQYQQQHQQHQQQPPLQSHGTVAQGSMQADESKVSRLMEMGFPRESVVSYLIANSNDEEAALNGLLSGSSISPPTGGSNSAQQGQPPQAPSPSDSSSSGFFSKIWGS